MNAVLERSPVLAEEPMGYVMTAASVSAAQAVLANMTPAHRDALRARIYRRSALEETRRQDFALNLQIRANPEFWL